ncbi:Hypothetical_protein [Hexamita inflata]|uniref:Hypothetical_protein n=1 Tax=Hexamita inflata TaxID=28002 RepID=A0AA86TGQ8_9EUKA|nr:Hypothetical protein HINF_LOCUS423 [Hexamita inflata]
MLVFVQNDTQLSAMGENDKNHYFMLLKYKDRSESGSLYECCGVEFELDVKQICSTPVVQGQSYIAILDMTQNKIFLSETQKTVGELLEVYNNFARMTDQHTSCFQ